MSVITAAQLSETLAELGVRRDDVLFLHSGMQYASRIAGDGRDGKLQTAVNGFAAAVADGVLILPTFTYSFCIGEVFDVDRTPSTVGMLTEHFRLQTGVRRTPEPIFSSAVLGRVPDPWHDHLFEVTDKDCFGAESIFGYLAHMDAKLVFFGVGFEYCTFVYFVEQALEVPYRYQKPFQGEVVHAGATTRVVASYFVRDLKAGVENDFSRLAADLLHHGGAKETRMAGGPRVLVTSAKAVLRVASEGVRSDSAYLLRPSIGGGPVVT